MNVYNVNGHRVEKEEERQGGTVYMALSCLDCGEYIVGESENVERHFDQFDCGGGNK